MNFQIKLFFSAALIIIPSICFGAVNFEYSFSDTPRYYNTEEIGSDLIVTKKFYDGTQEDIFWRIRPEDLPVTEDFCDTHEFEGCLHDEVSCFKPCFRYGPQFITHAKNTNKIYFLIDTTEVGATGIGERLLFVGDLNTKKIKYLAITDGFLKPTYSPNKKYVVFSRSYELTIANILTDEVINITKDNVQTDDYKEIHYLKDVHWISNNQFTYVDKSYGFAKEPAKIIGNTYDISKNKIVSSKNIK